MKSITKAQYAMREPAEPQGFIKPNGVGIPALQDGEEVKLFFAVDRLKEDSWHTGPMVSTR